MKALIAIMTCRAYHARTHAQRETWLKEVDREKFDVIFFYGLDKQKFCAEPMGDDLYCQNDAGKCAGHQYTGDFTTDTVTLNCPDDYRNFPLKCAAMRAWALGHGYENVMKMDDDVFAAPDRLEVPVGDYVGRVRGPSGSYPAPYCSGFSYWMTRRAMKAALPATWNGDIAEDRFLGNELLKAGIHPTHDCRYAVAHSKNNGLCSTEGPLNGNSLITSCEYGPEKMREVWQDYKSGRKTLVRTPGIQAGTLNKVSVMVKTFLRDGYLHACLDGLERNFQDCKIVVVDDGYEDREKIKRYARLRAQGHSCVWLPFDSGFGAKANAAISAVTTEYVLVASDDFDFSDPRVRPGVEKMVQVLNAVPSMGVASGRMDGKDYEFCFRRSPGRVQEEKRYHGQGVVDGVVYKSCDLTVNYSLIRRSVFEGDKAVRWDGGDVKIGGGEHGAFFLDVQEAGWGVCVVEGAEIRQFKWTPTWEHKTYRDMRRRARQEGRPCLKRRGIDEYVCWPDLVEKC